LRNTPLVFVVPGSLETRTGGYEYNRQIVLGLRALGWSVATRELDGSFPRPTPAALAGAARVLASIPDHGIALVDGLALGAMPDEIERAASKLRIVGIVHLPLASEIGLDAGAAAVVGASERRALARCSLVVVTGRSSIPIVLSYGVSRGGIVLVEPGTAQAPLATGSNGGPLQLLCVATLNHGKGHSILFRALRSLPDRDWRLMCVGSLQRDPTTVQRLRDQLAADGLADRIVLTGELDAAALDEAFSGCDVFVLATLQETYGMAVAEAIARGLPVVSTRTGAIPDLVGDDGGLLVPPGDEEAFAGALRQILDDRQLRDRLGSGARRRRDSLPRWAHAARKMSDALDALVSDGRVAV
jgi:hypothetical protein